MEQRIPDTMQAAAIDRFGGPVGIEHPPRLCGLVDPRQVAVVEHTIQVEITPEFHGRQAVQFVPKCPGPLGRAWLRIR